MHFGSDNWAGAHPAIAASLSAHAGGYATPYGMSTLDRAVQQRLSEIFECDVAVFFVATGTASNSLALTSIAKPGGIVFAHREAHIVVDECGAPEYFSSQLRITPVDGPDGKMDVADLRRHVARIAALDVHGGRPNAISVTQPTESGTVYSLEELDAIAAVAKEYDLPLLMDGARFANGLVSLSCSPAEMTWKRGVDILSFGGTKNGCWCAEAVILFDKDKARDFAFIHKRAGQLLSKSTFVSAQLDAYLRDGLWLNLAHNANRMATQLSEIFMGSKLTRLIRKPQGNEVFVIVQKRTVVAFEAAGVVFLEWPSSSEHELGSDEQLCRFVTSFATTAEDINSLRGLLL